MSTGTRFKRETKDNSEMAYLGYCEVDGNYGKWSFFFFSRKENPNFRHLKSSKLLGRTSDC